MKSLIAPAQIWRSDKRRGWMFCLAEVTSGRFKNQELWKLVEPRTYPAPQIFSARIFIGDGLPIRRSRTPRLL